MNDLFLLDTSAWIMTLKKNPMEGLKNRVDHLLRENAVAVMPIVKVEILGGTKSEPEFERLDKRLDSLICLEMDEDAWKRAARTAYDLRKRGITVPYTDVIIAAAAIRHNAVLLHMDRHFDMIATQGSLRVESFAGKVL